MSRRWRERVLTGSLIIAIIGIVWAFAPILLATLNLGFQRPKVLRGCAPLPTLGAEPSISAYVQWKKWHFHCANPEEVTDATIASWTPHLKRLQAVLLYLNGSGITDEALAHLETVESLTNLRVSGTAISDEGLKSVGRMKNLRVLHVNDTPITDDGLAHLVDLPCLEFIDLSGTRVTQEAIDEFRLARPSMHVDPYRVR